MWQPFCRPCTSPLSIWLTSHLVGMGQQLGPPPVHLPWDRPSASPTPGLGVCVFSSMREGSSFSRAPVSLRFVAARMTESTNCRLPLLSEDSSSVHTCRVPTLIASMLHRYSLLTPALWISNSSIRHKDNSLRDLQK